MAPSSFPAMHCCCCYCCSLLFPSVVFFLFFSFPSPSHGQSVVPAMYVFGDSLVDVGNNNHLPLSLLKADFPHNGIDYPGRIATGRYSNGKNLADFLAERLGVQTPAPYLSLLAGYSGIDPFLKGVNFASGGAGILKTTNKDQCVSFDEQIELFSKVYGELIQKLGSVETQKHLSQSIIVLVIGSNDLLEHFKFDSPQRGMATPRQFVDLLVLTLRDQLMRIYGLGARKIVFVGVGPIGCCPSQRIHSNTGECIVESNHWSSVFNEGTKSLLQEMNLELSDMNYSYFDAFSSFREYIQKPAAYGFVDVKTACCGLGNLNGKVACVPVATCCSNRRDHLFWDLYHPTEVVSRMFSDTIFDGSWPYVDPINLRQLVAL